MAVFTRRATRTLSLLLLILIVTIYFFKQKEEQPWPYSPTIPDAPPGVIPVEIPHPFTWHRPTPNETFVTYLPHSGFHNQRIELENALLLAAYLNRTLLLPSVFLGNPAMPWLRFEKMYERLLLQTKRGLDHCVKLPSDAPLPSECLNYFRWTTVPWSFFFNLESLTTKVRIVWRNDLSYEWMYENLGIQSKDIYYIRDVTPYDYRVYDEPESQAPLTRFLHRIDLASLEAIQEPVLHFGSVFGTGRVLAQTEEHTELLRFVRTHMTLRNPVLMDTAERIVSQLGGVGQFVGIHYRSGDGLFRVRAGLNLDDIYHQLVDAFTDLTVDQVAHLEQGKHDEDRLEDTTYEVRQLRKFEAVENVQKPIEVNHPSEDILGARLGRKPAGLRLECSAPTTLNERFQKTVIYLATDTPSPRTHPLLQKIYATFPCVFDLSHFTTELDDLKRIDMVQEKVKLESYLIPMLDAMIAAQGHTFIGTVGSTFSSYIERQLHPVYTNKTVIVPSPLKRKKNTPRAQ